MKHIIDKHGRPVIHAVFNSGWGFYTGRNSFINLFWYLGKSVKHNQAAKLAPMTANVLILFYRKCWMFAKTFMNVKLEELEIVT